MRRFLLLLLLLNGLLLPVSALALLLVVNMFNPLAVAFVTGFTIENRTSEPLRVTPVGTIGDGHRSLLPVYLIRFPAVPAIRSRDFLVPARGSSA